MAIETDGDAHSPDGDGGTPGTHLQAISKHTLIGKKVVFGMLLTPKAIPTTGVIKAIMQSRGRSGVDTTGGFGMRCQLLNSVAQIVVSMTHSAPGSTTCRYNVDQGDPSLAEIADNTLVRVAVRMDLTGANFPTTCDLFRNGVKTQMIIGSGSVQALPAELPTPIVIGGIYGVGTDPTSNTHFYAQYGMAYILDETAGEDDAEIISLQTATAEGNYPNPKTIVSAARLLSCWPMFENANQCIDVGSAGINLRWKGNVTRVANFAGMRALTPKYDAYIQSSSATTELGAATTFRIGFNPTGSVKVRSLLRSTENLVTTCGVVPGSTVTSLALKAQAVTINATPGGELFECRPVLKSGWDDAADGAGVTYNDEVKDVTPWGTSGCEGTDDVSTAGATTGLTLPAATGAESYEIGPVTGQYIADSLAGAFIVRLKRTNESTVNGRVDYSSRAADGGATPWYGDLSFTPPRPPEESSVASGQSAPRRKTRIIRNDGFQTTSGYGVRLGR